MLSTIIGYVVSAALGWLARHLQEMIKDWQIQKADEQKNADIRKANEAATTPKEREDAAKSIADKFGS